MQKGLFEVRSTIWVVKTLISNLSTIKRETGTDLLNDRMAVQWICEAAEKAEVEPSSTTQTDLHHCGCHWTEAH